MNILVLCTGNSCRSQIAEAYLRQFAGNKAQVFSAGVETHGVNPKAIETLLEDGIDIRHHSSNHVDEYKDIAFDFIVTVCDNAKERCPVFPSKALRIHTNFRDPAKAEGSADEIAAIFREVRNEIREFCKNFVSQHLS